MPSAGQAAAPRRHLSPHARRGCRACGLAVVAAARQRQQHVAGGGTLVRLPGRQVRRGAPSSTPTESVEAWPASLRVLRRRRVRVACARSAASNADARAPHRPMPWVRADLLGEDDLLHEALASRAHSLFVEPAGRGLRAPVAGWPNGYWLRSQHRGCRCPAWSEAAWPDWRPSAALGRCAARRAVYGMHHDSS